MRKLAFFAAIAFASFASVGSAHAQDYEQVLERMDEKYQQFDMNLNGSLEFSEFWSFGVSQGWNDAQIGNIFNRSDIDGSNSVTFGEFWENGGESA